MRTCSVRIWGLCLIVVLLSLTVGVVPHVRADGTQLLVGNAADNSVLSYDGTTGVFLSTFVPSGSGGLDTPQNLTIGPDGNLYVSSWANHRIKRYDGQTGAFTDDFVPSGSGGLANPDQVVFGPDGQLYVSSRFNATISRYDGQTGTFVDTFVADSSLFGFVGFTFGPDGNIYAGMFNCCGAQRILRFNGTTGAFMDVFNSGGPPLDSAFAGLVFGPDGHLYASRFHADTIERYDGTTGAFIDTFVPAGSGGLNTPDYLTFGPDGHLYVASLSTGNILRYDGTTGAFIDVFTSGGGVLFPKGLVFFTPAVANDPPDCTTATASPLTIWPPNHYLLAVRISGVTDPDGDPVTTTATAIFQDEAVNAGRAGAGNTSPDATLSPLAVRAERNGNPKSPGDGRVYHITFTAEDGMGGTCSGTVQVCVPHDQRPGSTCVDDRPLYDSLVP